MTALELADAPTMNATVQATQLPPAERCRRVQYALKAGATFTREGSQGLMSIQTISGQGKLNTGVAVIDLGPGGLATLERGQSAAIQAQSDLLLLISEALDPSMPC